MRPVILGPYTPAAASANGFADDIAYVGGGYVLTVTTPNDSLAHLVTILGNAATNHSAKTFTITGTDADDNSITEGLAGPNGNVTVTSVNHYKTVTSVTVSATTGADTFDIGWSAVAVSKVLPLSFNRNPFSVSLFGDVSGTISYTIQHTFGDVLGWRSNGTNQPEKLTWNAHATLAAKTADADSNYAFPVRATRILINSVTATATITYTIIQSEQT